MRESLAVCFLYRTVIGRLFLKLLVHPNVSKLAGKYLSSGASKWLIPYFIHKHKIDMRDIDVSPEGFCSFNDFFIRKRNRECMDMTYGHLISPCDGFLSVIKIKGSTVLDIKNTKFTVEDLLKNSELAGQFQEGTALVFRLTPADYHRYCYTADGKILLHRKIQGKLHCVRPVALRTVPVFVQNSREYEVIGTNQFDTVIQMEIGALLVGKIRNGRRSSKSVFVHRGDEKGYFEFGGSTIILLVQKDKIDLNKELYKKKNCDGEIPVSMGEYVAKATYKAAE